MRSSIFVLLALCGTAWADGGGYFIETVGWGSYRGDLEQFSRGEARLQIGGGAVRGPWALEASFTLFIPDQPYSSCSTGKCLAAAAPPVDLVIGNLDVRRAWRILRPRVARRPFGRSVVSTAVTKIGIDIVLHGGPRWAICETPRDAYSGPGLGGGTTLEVNLKAVSMFVDLGMDVAMLRGDGGDVMTARLPYLTAGMRLGWF